MKKERFIVYCAGCKKEIFLPRYRLHSVNHFCSIDCRSKWQSSEKNPLRKNKIKKCKNCEQEFDLRKTKAGDNQKFCSRKCAGEFRSKNKIFIKKLILKNCIYCGKEFEVWPYRKNAKYCSPDCHDQSRRDHLICPICGVFFSSPKYEKRKYCSQECAKNRIIQTSKGELEIYDFLIQNNIKVETQKAIHSENGFYKPDIIVNNNIIEFYGIYWHCHESIFFNENEINYSIGLTAKEKREIDQKRVEDLKKIGYNVLIIWEHEWEKRNNFCKKRILSFLNKGEI